MKFENQNIFFTSDNHFGHKNVIKYSNRPFDDVEQMNRQLIENINKTVKADDVLFFLGDFMFGKPHQAINTLNQIVCQNKHLIIGNHDEDLVEDKSFRHCFNSVQDYLEIKVKDNDVERGVQKIILFHFPILEWNKGHKGSWMLHGHTHGNLKIPDQLKNKRILDVGVDCHNYCPVSYTAIKKIFKNCEDIQHHD